MSVCTIRTSTTTGDFTESVTSVAGSVKFLLEVLPRTIENMVYNRVSYQDLYFDSHNMSGTPYVTFSSSVPRTHELCKVYHWVRNAMKSLERKYLKELYLIILDKQTNRVLEHYCYIIKYNNKKVNPSSEEVTVAATQIFEVVNMLGKYKKFESHDIYFALQVVLNDDTPDSYVTPLFERGAPIVQPTKDKCVKIGGISTGYHKVKITANGDFYSDEETPVEQEINAFDQLLTKSDNINSENTDNLNQKIELKQLDKCGAKKSEDNGIFKRKHSSSDFFELRKTFSNKKQLSSDDGSNSVLQKPHKTTTNQKTGTPQKRGRTGKENKPENTNGTKRQCKPKKQGTILSVAQEEPSTVMDEEPQTAPEVVNQNVHHEDNFDAASTQDGISNDDHLLAQPDMLDSNMDDGKINCQCRITSKLLHIKLIMCSQCEQYEHLACIGFKADNDVPQPHICFECHHRSNSQSLDKPMNLMNSDKKRILLAVIRLLLFSCVTTNSDPNYILSKLPQLLVQMMTRNLLKLKLLKMENGNLLANMEKMQAQIHSGIYFRKNFDSMQLE